MYPHPFSAAYWRAAAREVKDLRKLTFAALMIAMCIVLSHVPSIPLFGGTKVTWGFLARSVCALVCGPVTISHAEVVSKSYPTYWQHLRALGGVGEP